MKVSFQSIGNFKKSIEFLKTYESVDTDRKLNEAAQLCCLELQKTSPIRTGQFANGWTYNVGRDEEGQKYVNIYNTSHKEVPNLASMLEFGFMTPSGYYHQGTHFIEQTINRNSKKIKDIMRGD